MHGLRAHCDAAYTFRDVLHSRHKRHLEDGDGTWVYARSISDLMAL